MAYGGKNKTNPAPSQTKIASPFLVLSDMCAKLFHFNYFPAKSKVWHTCLVIQGKQSCNIAEEYF